MFRDITTDAGCGEMLAQARMDAGLSTARVAALMGISERTVRNWESGSSSPSMPQALQLFAALGLSPVPYIQHWLYPEQCRDESSCKRRIHHWLDHMATTHHIQQLAYILCGRHGSSAASLLEMICADLACPMSDRYAIAAAIMAHYRLREARKELNEAVPSPDMNRLQDAIVAGLNAAAEGRESYNQFRKE